MTRIFLTTGDSWQVPADWNSADNSIECIGGGGAGSSGVGGHGGCGGGGGAYSKIVNLALTPDSFVDYAIGGATWLKDISTVLAKGGSNGLTYSGGAGGAATDGVGSTKYSGGDGAAYAEVKGGGGGGAAGLYGNGGNAYFVGNDMHGGTGDAGHGGVGGVNGSNGGAGQEYDSTHGSGGGGGGGQQSSTGGYGGYYGGGGGGGGEGASGSGGRAGLIIITYTPFVAPTVSTVAASSKEETTATLNGNITAIGGQNADLRGFDWGLTDSYGSSWTEGTSENYQYGTGAFSHGITGLSPGTTYHFRAKAHNSAGWGYGSDATFITKPAAPTNVQATDGVHTDKVVITWTKSTGATGYQVYRNGTPLGWLGDVATYDDTGADAPTITPGSAAASDGVYTTHVALSLSGQSVSNGTTHTYKVRAKNATGESSDSGTDTGYRNVGSLTYQWQRSSGDSDADYSNISGATTASYNDTGAPSSGDGRYYRCVENATGAAQAISSSDRGYRLLQTISVTETVNVTDSISKQVAREISEAITIADSIIAVKSYLTGGYIGDIIDCTALIDTYDRLEWSETIPSADQDTEVEIRSSVDKSTWSDWEVIYTTPCRSFITPVRRYLEWRVTLLTTDKWVTPSLLDVSFYYTKTVE